MVAEALSDLWISFLEMRASRTDSTFRPATRQLGPAIRRAFKGTLMLNSDYLLDDASKALRLGEADAGEFRLASTICQRRSAQRPGHQNVLYAWACRLYRLSDAIS
jgi:hypothetical protein